MDRRVFAGETEELGVAIQPMQPSRLMLGEDVPGNRHAQLRQAEMGGGFLTHTAGKKIAQAPVRFIQHTDDGVSGADDFPAGAAETGQQPLRVPFRCQLQAHPNHRVEPWHGRLGLLRQLRQQQAQVFLPKLFGRWRGHGSLSHSQNATTCRICSGSAGLVMMCVTPHW